MNDPKMMGGDRRSVVGEFEAHCEKSVYFLTLGCKLNQCESAELRRRFEQKGYRLAEDLSLADTVFVSTCGVTARAEQKSRQAIRHILSANPHARVVVAGCAVQRAPESFVRIPGVVTALGSQERLDPFPFLDSQVRLAVADITPNRIEIAAGAPHGRTRTLLKIQDGCSVGCTYCVVPQCRGPSRCVPPDEALTVAQHLVEQGFHEIVLSGVNIGDYGRGISGWNLSRLVDGLVSLSGDFRIRLSSLEPWTVTPDLLQRITDSDGVCPHLHIPLQSGSSDVLRRMGRPYDRSNLEKLLGSIAAIDGIGLGADVIAGFPGESPDDFLQTLDVIEKYPFSYLHIFPFSPRPGTPAYDFPNQLTTAEITRRARILREKAADKKRRFLSSMVGTTQSVLFEHKYENPYRHGTAANYVKVRVKNKGIKSGDVIRIKITESTDNLVTGISTI